MKKINIAFLAAAVVLVSGGYAFGVSTTKTIYACVSSSSGSLTKVSTSAPKCPKGTKSLTWNQQGPQGLQGKQGLQGAQGNPGVQGLPGETHGFFIKAQNIEYTVLMSDIPSFRGINIDGTWWSIDDLDYFAPPFLNYVASQMQGDVLVYKSPSCAGPAQGYLSMYRDEGEAGYSYQTYLFPSYGNVAVKIGSKFYSASIASDNINDTASYFDGYRCRNGQAPLPDQTGDSEPMNGVFDLKLIEKPLLTFDSPLQVR